MLSFRVYRMEINDRHYILMPKLNREQMRLLESHFAETGFRVKSDHALTALKASYRIHVDPSGLCWSRSDPSDHILPLMHEILGCGKEESTVDDLRAKYYCRVPLMGGGFVRLRLRLECAGNWVSLRARGSSGLAPDELLLARAILDRMKGPCEVVTNFAVEGSKPVIMARKLYYIAKLPATEVSDSLACVGETRKKQSYLPSRSTLALPAMTPKQSAQIFAEMGDWCPFRLS